MYHVPLDRWPTAPPEGTAASNVKQRLSADLEWWTGKLSEIRDNIADSYDPLALEKLENYLYAVGSWFNKIRAIDGHPYKSWIGRSERCQNQIEDIINKADLAAYNFQQARGKYNRSVCRRGVENLIFAIQNLRTFNDQRTLEV